MSDDERSLLVLYATETGSAQEVADRVARQCRRLHFKCRVLSMDAYSLSDLVSEELVVFIISTTGSGTEPRSMTPLWKMLLRADLPEDLFQDLPIGVFGLGDSGYDKFCWPAKRLSRRLTSLGAVEICERGEGDDQHQLGIDGALEPWIEKLKESLLQYFPLSEGEEVLPESDIPPARISLEKLPITARRDVPLTRSELTFSEATVHANKRITADDWFQDVRHFEFEFEDDISFSPGDVAAIYPIADAEDVQEFLDSMGWLDSADVPLKITHAMKDQTLPENLPPVLTLREIFSQYLDFNAVPRRPFFEYLRYFTDDTMEREKLTEFLSLEGEGAEDLYEYCHQVRRTVREILADFWHAKVPKEYIFDVFPPLRLRQFSIASSVKKYPKQIHLCVAIVKYKTKLKVPRKGVCSTYLARLKPGDKIWIGIQKGLLHHPPKLDIPVICIGPGTGVAPMRSLIEERVNDGSTANTLYFGCRSAQKDQHYGDEWKSLSREEELTYRTAFSRDGPEGVKRTYVQDLIRADAENIWQLIGKDNAWVYISGSSNKMPAAVKEAITYAIITHGGLAEDEAKKYVDTMLREGRMLEECWS